MAYKEFGETEIAESAARGAVAEIYADIRGTLGLPLVNLIWRRLATDPDALEWAWQSVRPVYASGVAEREAAVLLERLALPRLPAMPPALLQLTGLGPDEQRTVAAVLDAYNRGNSLNLVALSTLIIDSAAEPDASPAAQPVAPRPAEPARGAPPSASPLPPIAPLEALAPSAREMVLRLNAFGVARGGTAAGPTGATGGSSENAAADPPTERDGVVIASLYRHLAQWPGYLALAWSALAPHAADGTLDAAIAQTRAAALAHGARAAPATPAPPHASSAPVRALVTVFIDTAIARMIPIGLMLRHALRAPQP